MKTIKEYSSIIESEIRNLPYSSLSPELLYAPISYGLLEGGKRLRPVLLLMACEAFGGNIDRALQAGLGIEMFHNFTLLHDDVMDNSDLRRGRPTVHAKWDKNIAILSGDCMLTLATEMLMNVPDKDLRTVLDIFNNMAIEVYEGQRLDMDFEESNNVILNDYMIMIRKKTSALLAAACKIGAIIGGATNEDSERMFKFGEKLGIAFQIMDDYLDLYGDEKTFGKPIGGDVLNDKKTFLLLSLANESPEILKEYEKIIASNSGIEKINAVRALFDSKQVHGIYEKEIERFTNEAIAEIEKTDMSHEGKTSFSELAVKLLGRKR